VFKLGTKYSESMGATVLDANGKEVPIVMGSYGIGLERIMAAAIELYHDADGIQWPLSIAPFHCLICLLSTKDPALVKGAEQAYRDLQALGLEVLLDDRDERPGVKFKDADLIGIPVRINFGSKKYAAGITEWVDRSTRKLEDVPLEKLLPKAAFVLETGRLP